MEFKPIIKKSPKLMDARIFKEGIMGLRNELLVIPLE
jgi:propionate CoA-transferase